MPLTIETTNYPIFRMLISRARAEVTTSNLVDEAEIMIKASRYQITLAMQSDHISNEGRSEIQIAVRELTNRIFNLERVKLQLLMIGDFIFGNQFQPDEEIAQKLNIYADMRRYDIQKFSFLQDNNSETGS